MPTTLTSGTDDGDEILGRAWRCRRPAPSSGALLVRAGEQLQEWLGGDFDEPAEPQNRGWPLAVVDELVRRCAPNTEERGSFNEVEDGRQLRGGVDVSRRLYGA